MNWFFVSSAAVLLHCSFLFSYFNEKHYEGMNEAWKNHETVEDRLQIIAQFLPEDPSIFEVGAKDGEESVKLAKTWPRGMILSFEANKNQFINYLAKSENFSNMHGYNLAVNTYNGFATFHLCWGSTGNEPIFEGASSLLEPFGPYKNDYKGPMITVPCVIFEDWCLEHGVKAIDFIWLDIEGFELQFLKSSPEILKTVKVIHTETNFSKFREGTTQYVDLKSYLESIGFKLIAHWYNEGLQGDAIFVRKELADNGVRVKF
jgi:FkbM family methyltransferase